MSKEDKFEYFEDGDLVTLIPNQAESAERCTLIGKGVCKVTGVRDIPDEYRKAYKEKNPEKDEMHPQLVKVTPGPSCVVFPDRFVGKQITFPGCVFTKKKGGDI